MHPQDNMNTLHKKGLRMHMMGVYTSTRTKMHPQDNMNTLHKKGLRMHMMGVYISTRTKMHPQDNMNTLHKKVRWHNEMNTKKYRSDSRPVWISPDDAQPLRVVRTYLTSGCQGFISSFCSRNILGALPATSTLQSSRSAIPRCRLTISVLFLFLPLLRGGRYQRHELKLFIVVGVEQQ